MRNRSLLACVTLLAGLGAAEPARAQITFAPAESVTVVPGAQFKQSGLHRFFFGTRYRKLWTTPIKIPVLRLGQIGGGLTPTEKGGGMQTKSLRLKGADGKQYQFRSLAKDPASVLPPELRNTVAADILRDQTSAQHPAGMVAVGPLLDAAGVLNAAPILVQLADDPALGEYRAEFAGMVGDHRGAAHRLRQSGRLVRRRRQGRVHRRHDQGGQ